MKKRGDEEFGNVSNLIDEWLQSDPILSGKDAKDAFEEGLRPFCKDPLRDLKEKVLKSLQNDEEFENISKLIYRLIAEWKRLGDPDVPELELILENLSLIRASVKSKILAAAIVRALDVQTETDLDGWYRIRAACNQALRLEPDFSDLENLLHVVKTRIHELELAEEDTRRQELFELAVHGNAFRQGSKQSRQDALGEVLERVVKEYFSQHDKLPQWKEVVDRLETLASMKHEVIQEVDIEAEFIYWRRKGGMEEKTAFEQLRERLTPIRKKNSKSKFRVID
ncbi:MAG: hypothetical protein OEV28_10020 [Nitrospirota bacterium]|nr:hypothetical protein [Nitrospirota bacterium]